MNDLARLLLVAVVFEAVVVDGLGCSSHGGPALGEEKSHCYSNGTCNRGLSCFSNRCVRFDPTGSAGRGGAGATGTSGASGGAGVAGTGGLTVAGASGTAGSASAGASGTAGASGSAGVSGNAGGNGLSGTSGNAGSPGGAGSAGTFGMAGQSGTAGAAGSTSTAGASGSGGSTGAAGATGLSFAAPVMHMLGNAPWGVVLADFNRDNHLDVAAVNLIGGNGNILFGSGTGSFPGETTTSTGSWSNTVVAWDFNNDKVLDLAVTLEQSGVIVNLGLGDGTFQRRPLITSDAPRGIAADDVDSDGNGDFIVCNTNLMGVTVSLGRGDGSFKDGVFYDTGGNTADVVVSDFNGDKKKDLAVSSGGYLSVLLGNGDGTFKAAVKYMAGSVGTSGVAVGDLDGDGAMDVVAGNNDANTLSVFLGNGDGTLRKGVEYPTGRGGSIFKIGDLSLDGKLDIVETNVFDGNIGVLLGNGNGTFQAVRKFLTDKGTRSVAIGDLNEDGKPDLAVVNQDANNLSVLLNTTPKP